MTKRLLTITLIAALLIIGPVMSVSAQIFGGIVYDPTNYANAVLRYGQLQAQLSQLITTYSQIRTQYLLLFTQAQRLPYVMWARYQSLRTPWKPLVATSQYGLTSPWITAANTGFNPAAAVLRVTQSLTPYGPGLSRLSAAELLRVQSRYDRTQLTDGAITNGLEAIGRLRQNQATVEATLQNLESDAYSDDPALHTQVAVLDKINASSVAGTRMVKDTNYVLVSLLEQQVLEATERRESTAQAIDAHVAFLSEAPALLARTTASTTQALSTFRIP
jgi:hypothetical protein